MWEPLSDTAHTLLTQQYIGPGAGNGILPYWQMGGLRGFPFTLSMGKSYPHPGSPHPPIWECDCPHPSAASVLQKGGQPSASPAAPASHPLPHLEAGKPMSKNPGQAKITMPRVCPALPRLTIECLMETPILPVRKNKI